MCRSSPSYDGDDENDDDDDEEEEEEEEEEEKEDENVEYDDSKACKILKIH